MPTLRPTAALACLLAATACGGRNADTDSAGARPDSVAATPTAGAPATAGVAAGAQATGATSGNGAPAGTPAAAPALSLASPATKSQLASVDAAAKAGLTTMPPAVAVPLLRSLADKLVATNDTTLLSISRDLDELRSTLEPTPGNGGVNGHHVASILMRVGPKVTAVADRGGEAAGTLRSIGSELTAAAKRIEGSR